MFYLNTEIHTKKNAKYNDLYRGEYICPHCWVQADKVKSGATLIVSPAAICFQWIDEIQKHVKHRNSHEKRNMFFKTLDLFKPRKAYFHLHLADG